jgi:hypothetical protein
VKTFNDPLLIINSFASATAEVGLTRSAEPLKGDSTKNSGLFRIGPRTRLGSPGKNDTMNWMVFVMEGL